MTHKNTFWIFLLVAVLFLNGCDLSKNYTKIDREGDLEFQDYRDALGPRDPAIGDEAGLDSGVPPLMSYVSPVSEDLKAMPLVSVNLNQTVPLRDALFELAKEADYDLVLDPNIRGSVIFTARNKPFDKVIERIADIANLRYEFDEDSLRIQVDSPYTHIYKLDYLNIIRQSTSSISNDVSVVSGEGTDTGSRFETETTSESDFWTALEANISQMLDVSLGAPSMRTVNDPQITVSEPRPVPANEVATTEDDSAPQAVLQVDSLPVGMDNDNAATDERVAYSINRQAGTLMVYAPKKVQDKVAEYLDTIRKTMTSQVLIEAKVMEVTLNDEFAAGIDWDAFDFFGGDISMRFRSGDSDSSGVINLARGALDPATSPETNFRLGIFGNDAQAVVDMVSRFGVVKALASPRLTVLNNQSAVLNVATNLVFFEIDIETQVDEGTRETTVDSEIRNVPEGVLINVHPSIDLDTNTISLALRPTVTRVVSSVADPGVAFVAAEAGTTIESLIPQVNVQEIDSVIRINSGEAIVMGGLMQDRTESEQNSLPGLGELPIAGSLFRNQTDRIQKTELVIFLKATIVENGNTVHDADRDLYRKFSKDRHPFKL
jgi:MSHA biogenesis protein MshL